MRGDMLLMVGAAVLLLMGAFWIFYRTLRPLGWIMFLQFFALLAGLVAARIFFGGLNVISIGFASILLGVGMDYSILVYHHFGSPHREDAAAWRTLRRAIWFSAAVTASAFYFLALTSLPGSAGTRRPRRHWTPRLRPAGHLAAAPRPVRPSARGPAGSFPPASGAAARFADRHRGLLTGSAVALVVSRPLAATMVGTLRFL